VVRDRIDALESFRKQLEGADVDLLREMVKIFAEQLMGADADALCSAATARSPRPGRGGPTMTVTMRRGVRGDVIRFSAS